MACTYELRGHKFNSELELDDFLLSNGHLMAILGDAVFDNTVLMNAALALIKQIEKEGKDAAWRHTEYKRAQQYMDGYETDDYKNPYIGVTSFLSGLTNSDGGLMFPEFRAEEYWDRRLKLWKESISNMTQEEKELFNIMYDNNPPTSISEDDSKKLRGLIEDKWDQQGVIGSCIHKIIELYFDKGINNPKGFKNLVITKELRNFVDKEINSDARKRDGKRVYTYEQLIPNSSVINDALEIAEKLKRNLEA